MATHPLPPESLRDLAEAYAGTFKAVIDLGFTCHDEDFALETDCPGWTVKDQFSHVAGVEAAGAGVHDPQVSVPDYPHLRHDFAREIEKAVEVRRPRTGSQVVAELQRLLPDRLAVLAGEDLEPDTVLTGPLGEMPAVDLLALRTVDLWVHEQDIRGALGRPGNLDSPAAALFVSKVLAGFPGRAARKAGLPVGTVVILESTGPVTAREGIRIVAGDDPEKPLAEPLFSGDSDGHGHPESVTTIRLTTEALTRLGAGRKRADEVHYSVEGDDDVARRVLDVLTITP